MIKEIAAFIARKTSLVVGTTLQVGHRTQNAPDQCSAVLEAAGGGLYFDLPDRNDKNIQVLSRANSYFRARTEAREVFAAIHGTAGWTLTAVPPATQNYEAQTIEALADPQYIGQDDKGRYEFSTNYIFRIQNL